METYYENDNTKLYNCDNYELLKSLPDNYIDLIYIDPPFSAGKTFKTKGGEFAFEDKFTLDELITYLVPRIKEIHRVLKDTGSFYIHGDYRYIPYIRIECDKIFGTSNFRNEIVWCYNGASNDKKGFISKHDTILRYSRSKTFTFNADDIRVPYNKETIARYNRNSCGYALTNKDEEVLNHLGKIPEDWWQICIIRNQPEKTGYPTQKPKELIERIIKASSNRGDLVADFFMGSCTTGEVALELGRRFIGSDIGDLACKISKDRIKNIQKED